MQCGWRALIGPISAVEIALPRLSAWVGIPARRCRGGNATPPPGAAAPKRAGGRRGAAEWPCERLSPPPPAFNAHGEPPFWRKKENRKTAQPVDASAASGARAP